MASIEDLKPADGKCTCPGPGLYDYDCPRGKRPHFVKATTCETDPLYMCIEVLEHRPRNTNPVKIYLIEMHNETGSWDEVFGSIYEASAFINGLRAGLSMIGKHFRLWGIHEHPHRRTEEPTP